MSQVGDDKRESGRSAFARHQWNEAYESLVAADHEVALDAEDLERLAEAARWSGHHPEILDAFERAEAAYCIVDDRRGAARVALQLAWEHYQRGDDAVASGWFARASTLLKRDTECREYALLLMQSGVSMFGSGDLETARENLARAGELARRTGDRDVEALTRIYQGHVLVNMGQETAGLALADEATASAMSGELGVRAAGTIYCSTIVLCRNRGDWRRAQEWTDASMRWCRRESVGGFPGLCRFHRAEIQRFRGALDAAEQDALEAVEELLAAARRFAPWALHELGEIRRRRGDRQGAAEAFRQATELGFDPQPGLALLRLDEGDAAGARAAIRRALVDQGGLARESLGLVLPAAVTIELAAGDIDAARQAAVDLEARAAASGSVAFAAASASARGEIALAEGRIADAVDELRLSWRGWSEVNAPFESAQSRVLLARAYAADGNHAEAMQELRGAQATFERLGAFGEMERMEPLLTKPQEGARLVRTFVFTDIVDSTRLVEFLGDQAWEDLLRWHDRTLRAAFAQHHGEEVKHEGDGFFVAFRDAEEAIDCAVVVQQALANHRREHGFAPRMRIGIHTAAANERQGDYSGKGVHAASRVASAAGPDEILVSRDAIDAAGTSFDVDQRRVLELKGLAEPVEVGSINWQE